MVTPVFGWSAGDIVLSIHIIIKMCKAFKEADDATSQYEESTAFLEGFKITLSTLDSHIRRNSNLKYATEISQQVKLIDAPYCRFEKFMLDFEPALSSTSNYGRVRKVPKKNKVGMGRALDDIRQSCWTEEGSLRSACTSWKFVAIAVIVCIWLSCWTQSKNCWWNNFYRDILQDISAQVSKLPEISQIETMINAVKDTTEKTSNELQRHTNRSAPGHEKNLAGPADRQMTKAERYDESNPKTAWLGQLATQLISTGITSTITGAIPSSISMTAIKFTFKLPRRWTGADWLITLELVGVFI